MLKRKLTEIGSAIYRNLFYPFVRTAIEIKTKSIMRPKSYMRAGSTLEGRNFIGKGTILNNTTVGYGSIIHDNGNFCNARIGKYNSIGPNVQTILGKHPLDGHHVSTHTALYDATAPHGFTYTDKTTFESVEYLDEAAHMQVIIANDIWMGNNVQILSGVTIGDGAVIGCGSVVTHDLEPYGIYAGVPARLIRKRFDDETIQALLELKWWDKGEDWIREHISQFNDVEELIREK